MMALAVCVAGLGTQIRKPRMITACTHLKVVLIFIYATEISKVVAESSLGELEMMAFREFGFVLAFTTLLSGGLVTVGSAAERSNDDRHVGAAFGTAHAIAVTEGAFVLQTTGFCEPSIDRFVHVDLVTGHVRSGGC